MIYKMDKLPAFLNTNFRCRKIGKCGEPWRSNLPTLVDSIFLR
jgi:hypothetical protein